MAIKNSNLVVRIAYTNFMLKQPQGGDPVAFEDPEFVEHTLKKYYVIA